MPQIPTFISKAKPTAESGSIKTNLQIPLSQTLGGALQPVTNYVVEKAVQENNTQNRSEALSLGNEFVIELHKLNESIYTSEEEGANKTLGLATHKEQSNSLIQKYKNRASNSAVSTMFTNNALSSVQKSFFRIDRQIQENINTKLDIAFNENQKDLLTTALFNKDGKFDALVLASDLEKLTTDTYTGTKSFADIQKMITAIPGTIQTFQGGRDIINNPRFALKELNKGTESLLYPDIPIKERTQLIKDAKGVLRPQITTEFKNYLTARSLGKKEEEMPRFNVDIVKEVFSKQVADQIIVQKKTADDNANNVNFLHSLKNQDLDFNLATIIKENEATLSINSALASNNFLTDAVANIKSQREDNPVQYILDTDSEIENEAIRVLNMSADPTKDAAQLDVIEKIVQNQEALGIPNKKVMTNQQSKEFVLRYNEAAKNSNGDELNSMMRSLAVNYGEYEGLALLQLRADGLSFGATVAVGLGNSTLAEIALSFDTKEEKLEIQKYLKDNEIKVIEIEQEITDGVSDFMDIVLGNTPRDSTESLTKTNEIKEFLTNVTAQHMIGNPGMSQKDATQFAIDSWNENFVLTDTYYIGKQQGDTRLNVNETNRIQDTTDLLKTFYLEDLDIVSFKSNTETDPVILSSKMRSQMRINGEWRNTPDGEGVVFGIVLDRGFAPVINSAGEQVIFKFNDKSRLVPGTDMVIDFDIGFNNPEETAATSMIDTFEKANQLARDEGITYEEALEKIRKPNIENIEFDDGKKNSKNPVGDQSKTDFSLFTKLAASEPTLGERFLADNNNLKMLSDHEGNELKPYNLEYNVNGKKVIEDFRTVGKGHRITEAEEKSGKIYTYDINNLTQEQVDDIFKQDVKKAVNLVNDLGKNSTINLDTINPSAYNILVQMAFQMGSNPKTKKGLAGFEKTLQFIKDGEYNKASKEMLDSTWHDQTPSRAKELSNLMAKIK